MSAELDVFTSKTAANVIATLSEDEKLVYIELLEPLFTCISSSKPGPNQSEFRASAVLGRLPDFLDTIGLFRYQLGRRWSFNASSFLSSSLTPNGDGNRLWASCEAVMYRTRFTGGLLVVPGEKNLFLAGGGNEGLALLQDSKMDTYGIRLMNKSNKFNL